MTSRRRTTSNQGWKNVVYINVEIYNVEQRPINVVHFNVDLNNVRQRRSNVVILNIDFHNVGQRWKIKIQKQNNIFELQRMHWAQHFPHFIFYFKWNM